MIKYLLIVGIAFLLHSTSGKQSILLGAFSSLFFFFAFCYLDTSYKKDGKKWHAFQHSTMWSPLSRYFSAGITSQASLDNDQQYIFCSFPHGACTVNHFMTMTDSCQMLSSVHTGDRRDLCASVLFYIPLLREILLWLGCVDASSKTAHHNLRKGRSILIFVGGEKEQLLTTPGEHTIYLSGRKGFIKLALEYGTPLVPMYAFGENECYNVSKAFIGTRQWLQQKYQIGLPFVWGRMGSLVPLRVTLHIEIGAPIAVQKRQSSEITPQDIEALHSTFCKAMEELFEKTKGKHGCDSSTKLVIL